MLHMDHETNPAVSDAEALEQADAGSEDVEAGVDSVLSIDDLKKVTGREYATREEAIEHLKNLNSFVGDKEVAEARKAAKEYNEFINRYADTNGLTPAEAKAQLLGSIEQAEERDEDDATASIKKELAAMKSELARKNFLEEYPEAKAHIKAIEAGAKGAGETLDEFYRSSGLQEVITNSSKVQQAEQSNIVSAKSRVAKSSAARFNQLSEATRKNPTEENRQALVAEFLKQTGQL